jgi:hypothetical protein
VTDYDFIDDPKDGSPKKPDSQRSETADSSEILMAADKLLVKAGLDLGVLSLKTGRLNPTLQQMAQAHAAFQAEFAEMGHQRWESRSGLLFKQLPEYTGFREVCAYSGYEQIKAAQNIFNSWRQSRHHWPWVNGRCDIWGYGMAFSTVSNLWYACGIFADLRAGAK